MNLLLFENLSKKYVSLKLAMSEDQITVYNRLLAHIWNKLNSNEPALNENKLYFFDYCIVK